MTSQRCILHETYSLALQVNTTLRRVLIVASVAVALYFLAATVATFTQLANAADRTYLGAGQPVFWSLIALFAALISYPLVLLRRLPKAMRPPDTDAPEDHASYESWLQRHMAKHPHADVSALGARGDVAAALSVLGAKADVLVRNTATNVFVSTALIQNGRLDGLVMLGTQLRLVWQIGALYNLRPSPRQLWYLYSNVAGTVLVASNLEELDFAEVAGPLVNSVAPSLAASIPGLQGVGNLLVNSIANGSANAFLTLRVGLIAKSYCAPIVKPEREAVRRSATLAALSMLSSITRDKGLSLARGVWAGAASAAGKAASSVVEGARRAGAATGAVVTVAVSSAADAVTGATRAVGSAGVVAGEKVAMAGRSIAGKAGEVGDSVGNFSRTAAKSVTGAVASAGSTTADSVSASTRAVVEGSAAMGRSTVQGITHAASKVSAATGNVLDSSAGLFRRKDKQIVEAARSGRPDERSIE